MKELEYGEVWKRNVNDICSEGIKITIKKNYASADGLNVFMINNVDQ